MNLEELSQWMKDRNLKGHWEHSEWSQSVKPHLWKGGDILQALNWSGELITTGEAGRRTIQMRNPGLSAGMTNTVHISVQLVKPGEVAAAHRHTAAAIRFIVKGTPNAYTLSLEEARVIIDAATAVVRADKGRAAIAVVDYNGNLVSLDSMDGTSGFWVKFAIGKALGAAALQQTTAESSEQYQTNPQRFHSALSMLGGEIILIPGGFPLIVNNVIVGAVGSAGHRGDGDVRAVKAGIAAWEKLRQSRK